MGGHTRLHGARCPLSMVLNTQPAPQAPHPQDSDSGGRGAATQGVDWGRGLQHTHLRIHRRGRWSLKKYLQPPPQPGQRYCQGIDDLGHLGAGERHQPGVVLEHSLAPTFTVGIYLGPCSAGAGTEIMGVRGQRWGASVQLCKPT